jgi:hypothetical protein
MTPIFTAPSCAIAGRTMPAANAAAPIIVVRRVVLIMRSPPEA